MKNLKNFEEKEMKNYSEVVGGIGGELSFTINTGGFFDGSLFGRLFDGIKGNADLNEIDEAKATVGF